MKVYFIMDAHFTLSKFLFSFHTSQLRMDSVTNPCILGRGEEGYNLQA